MIPEYDESYRICSSFGDNDGLATFVADGTYSQIVSGVSRSGTWEYEADCTITIVLDSQPTTLMFYGISIYSDEDTYTPESELADGVCTT